VLQSGIFPKVEPFKNRLPALFHVKWRTRLSILTPPVFESCKNWSKNGQKMVKKWSKMVKNGQKWPFLAQNSGKLAQKRVKNSDFIDF
jgi:hypothetical protein